MKNDQLKTCHQMIIIYINIAVEDQFVVKRRLWFENIYLATIMPNNLSTQIIDIFGDAGFLFSPTFPHHDYIFLRIMSTGIYFTFFYLSFRLSSIWWRRSVRPRSPQTDCPKQAAINPAWSVSPLPFLSFFLFPSLSAAAFHVSCLADARARFTRPQKVPDYKSDICGRSNGIRSFTSNLIQASLT